MSDHIDEGGPAFPVSTSDPHIGHQDSRTTWQFPGMTLRDYFAAKAMQGMLARPGSVNTKQDAEFAYMLADAMLKARNVQ